MAYDTNSPFFKQLIADNEARANGEEVLSVNGSPMGLAIWNLIVSKRDIMMWCKMKMKPTRSWKVSDVKKYFGIRGTGESLMKNFMHLHNDVFQLVYGEESK